jgi:magnesium chelatase subunit I
MRRPPDPPPGAARNDATAAQGDWGYLPPEPAGLRDVKSVVPLPLKKR